MENEIVVLHFETVEAAERALDAVNGLDAQGFLDLDGAAVITKDPDGWVRARSADGGEVTRAASLGGVVGLVVGGVMGLPVLGLLAGAGASGAHAANTQDLETLMSTVGDEMTEGSAALVLSLNRISDLDTVLDRLDGYRSGFVRAEVPEALRAEIDLHRRE